MLLLFIYICTTTNYLYEEFCLVFWPEEEQVSVVAKSRLLEGNAVGDTCSVRVRRAVHKGSILAIGKYPFSCLFPVVLQWLILFSYGILILTVCRN